MAYYDIFVSYSSDDTEAVETFVASLERKGLSCYFSAREIAPGLNWSEDIESAIAECGAVVFYWTRATVERPVRVREEILLAQRMKRFIIPFQAENVTPPPGLALAFASLNWIEAYRGPKLEPYIVRLADTVKAQITLARTARRPSPSPTPPPSPPPAPVRRKEEVVQRPKPAVKPQRQATQKDAETGTENRRRWILFGGLVGGATLIALTAATLFLGSHESGSVVSLKSDPSHLSEGQQALVRAQNYYCDHRSNPDPTGLQNALQAAAKYGGDVGQLASYRLGAQYLYGSLTSDSGVQNATPWLQSAGSYPPAKIYAAAASLPGAALPDNLPSALRGLPAPRPQQDTGWPAGVSPFDCASIDLDAARWS